MQIVLSEDPPRLVRIGRAPDPLAWPPLAFIGQGRYDDPHSNISTLYASTDRRTAFLETLDAYRPNLSLLARIEEVPGRLGWQISPSGDDSHIRGTIPESYFDRLIAEFHMMTGQRWLDLRSPASSEALRAPLANRLIDAGLPSRFVHGDLLGNNHRITRVFASWAIEHEFDGIAYASCHDPNRTCWALFSRARISSVTSIGPVSRTDPDLLSVMEQWKLTLPDFD